MFELFVEYQGVRSITMNRQAYSSDSWDRLGLEAKERQTCVRAVHQLAQKRSPLETWYLILP